ncbi:hypothetical protein Tco_0932130 [Tanacetum coccineum]
MAPKKDKGKQLMIPKPQKKRQHNPQGSGVSDSESDEKRTQPQSKKSKPMSNINQPNSTPFELQSFHPWIKNFEGKEREQMVSCSQKMHHPERTIDFSSIRTIDGGYERDSLTQIHARLTTLMTAEAEMQERMTRYEERQACILALLQDMARPSQLPLHPPGATTSGATTSAPSAPAVWGDTRMYVRWTVSNSASGTSHSYTPIVSDAESASLTETALLANASDPSTHH